MASDKAVTSCNIYLLFCNGEEGLHWKAELVRRAVHCRQPHLGERAHQLAIDHDVKWSCSVDGFHPCLNNAPLLEVRGNSLLECGTI